jgi:hypothetical protein
MCGALRQRDAFKIATSQTGLLVRKENEVKKTITLKGAAAKAFVESKMGKRTETDEERIERVLMALEIALKGGERRGAALILQCLARRGLVETADAVSGVPANLVAKGVKVTKGSEVGRGEADQSE